MPLYQYTCVGGHTHEELRRIAERSRRATCPECGDVSELGVSIPGLTRLEPIPMGREGHRRRAAKRREAITGKAADIDYNSRSENVSYGK